MKQSYKILVGCVGIPLFIFVALWLFAEWAWGGSIKTSLDSQHIPTAEYLLQHPQPTPVFLQIKPIPGTTLVNSLGALRLEVNLKADKLGILQWTQIFLNSQKLPRFSITGSYPGGLPAPNEENFNTAYFYFYQAPTLESGLYLFRIQIASSFGEFLNPDPNLSYEWAYRVE